MLGYPLWGSNPSLLGESLHILSSLLILGRQPQGGIIVSVCLSLSYLVDGFSLFTCSVGVTQLHFGFFSKGNCSTGSCRLGGSLGGEFRMFLCCHLEPGALLLFVRTQGSPGSSRIIIIPLAMSCHIWGIRTGTSPRGCYSACHP